MSSTLDKLVARYRGRIHRPTSTDFAAISRSAEPSGLGAVVRRPHAELPRRANQRGPLLCFDAVRSLGNLGSAIRSAAAFDAGAVVFLDRRIDPFDPAVVRASMGAIFKVPIVRTDERALGAWKRRTKARVVGTSARAHGDVRRVRVETPATSVILYEAWWRSRPDRSRRAGSSP